MKTTNPIARLFAASPFRPLQRHMRVAHECVEGLPPLLDALAAGDLVRAREHKETVFRLEHEADEIKNAIRSALPSTLLMPVARRDILDLLSSQDAVADAAQDAAGILVMDKLRVIPELMTPLTAFCDDVVAVSAKARDLVDRLQELVEVGFRGREAEHLLTMITEVAALESVTDEQGSELVRLLCDHESGMGPLSVIFWYELIRTLGRIADESENVGDRLRLLVAR